MRKNRTTEEIDHEYDLIRDEYERVVDLYLVWDPYPRWRDVHFDVSEWTFSKDFRGYNFRGVKHEKYMDRSVTSYLNFLTSRMCNLQIESNRVRMSKWGTAYKT